MKKYIIYILFLAIIIPTSPRRGSGGAVAGGLIGGFALGSMFSAANRPHHETVVVREPYYPEENHYRYKKSYSRNHHDYDNDYVEDDNDDSNEVAKLKEENKQLEEKLIEAQSQEIEDLQSEIKELKNQDLEDKTIDEEIS